MERQFDMRKFVLDNRVINDDSDCYVIAEIGHNHQGSLEKAKQLFKAAADCGVDAVKLQKRDNKTMYTKAMYNQPYLSRNSYAPTYGEHRDVLEFGRKEYIELQKYAAELGVTFISTAFDINSAGFLSDLDVPGYKIASGDLVNTPLLKHVAQFGKPMIVSTGGATMADIQRAYDAIMPINQHLCLLHCTASYPVEPEDMNLRAIETLRNCFPEIVIGLSDHQNGISMALVGYMLGARVIEKHFTLNRAWKGTDQAFSLEPGGMSRMVRDLQRARVALGDGVKRMLPAEEEPLHKMRKKLVAAQDLPAGHTVRREDVAFKSPGDGLLPYELDNVVGRTLRRALKEDESFAFEDLLDGNV